MSDKLAFLQRSDLFRDLPKTALQRISESLEEVTFRKGTTIITKGDPSDSCFFIRKGMVSVFTWDEEFQIELELNQLGEGAVIGEMGILVQEPRTASVRALTSVHAYKLTATVLVTILSRSPKSALSMMQILSRRILEIDRLRGGVLFRSDEALIDPQLLRRFPINVLERAKAIPVAEEDGAVTFAMVDTEDLMARDDLARIAVGSEVRTVAIRPDDFDRLAKEHFSKAKSRKKRARSLPKIQYQSRIPERVTKEVTERAGRVFDQALAEAVDRGASDLHIELEPGNLVIRMRVGGKLEPYLEPLPRDFAVPIVNRLKVMAGLDITERRRPQDGRLTIDVGGEKMDLRLSFIPAREGEKVVIRILDSRKALQTVDRVILAENLAAMVQQWITSPHGLILVTGPVGSGKTTTMNAALQERRSSDPWLNIMTIEDPIEYTLPGITQVQIDESIGFSFSTTLRSVLRQDPNVILVGEIRDEVTAKMAVEASLTGHLVLTTLHTNNALTSIVRLSELGCPPYLVSHALTGVLSQRLVGRVCPACSERIELEPLTLKELRNHEIFLEDAPKHVLAGAGCDLCRGSGFQDRIACLELLNVNQALRDAVVEGASYPKLRKLAEKERLLVPLHRYGQFLLKKGLTTPQEILRILMMN